MPSLPPLYRRRRRTARLCGENDKEKGDCAVKKIYLFGNWKMNQNVRETAAFCDEMAGIFAKEPGLTEETEFCLFPSFLSIVPAAARLKSLGVHVGAQNVNDHASGAYTGEVSPSMLAEAGCEYVLVGHSERRHIYGESSELVNLKARSCLASHMTPVLCVGETLEERLGGKTLDVVNAQLTAGVRDFPEQARFMVAYEPVWAIGTGKTASAQDAEEVCAAIKERVLAPVLYGGSVKASNSAEIFSQPSIDGGLIGGASLKAADYMDILRSFRVVEK